MCLKTLRLVRVVGVDKGDRKVVSALGADGTEACSMLSSGNVDFDSEGQKRFESENRIWRKTFNTRF